MTRLTVLMRETAHLSETERGTIDRHIALARKMLGYTPRATEQALTLKLQSYGECPRWTCVLIASAMLEEARLALPLAA